MDDYIEESVMFERKSYEILKKAEIEISEVTMEYLLSLSNEDLKILNDLILYYGDDDIFDTVGKAKLQVETKNIRSLAGHWLAKKELNPKAKPPNIHEVLKDEINKLNIASNESSKLIHFKSNTLTENQHHEIANIEATDVNEIKIHNHYQLDLMTLQFPLFTLKLNQKAEDFIFTDSNDLKITVSSGTVGRATIYDSDLWLYCITKLIQINYERGRNNHTRKVIFTGYDFLKKTGKTINGKNYSTIIKSLERLVKTNITFNKNIGNLKAGKFSSLLENSSYLYDENEKKIGFEVVLPEWLYNEICDIKIAKINPDYLKLKPFEKRIYHLAKFHCRDNKKSTPFNLDYFAKKVGSKLIEGKIKHFKHQIKKLTQTQPLPEYLIHYDNDKDQVYFTSRQMQSIENRQKIQLKFDAKARRELIENSQSMFASNTTKKKELENIQRVLEINFFEKNYPIFQTEILSEKKLKDYLKKFDAKYLMSKIIEFIDFDFTQKENPQGYFYTMLENKTDFD